MRLIGNITDKEHLIADKDNIDIDNNIMTASVEDYPFEDTSKGNLTPTLESDLLNSGRIYERDKILVDALMRERLVGPNTDIGSFENQEEPK